MRAKIYYHRLLSYLVTQNFCQKLVPEEREQKGKTLFHYFVVHRSDIFRKKFFRLPSSNADTAGREGLSYCVETCSSGGVDHSMSSVDVTPSPSTPAPGYRPPLATWSTKTCAARGCRSERGGPLQ